MVLKEVRSTEVFITLQQSLIFLPYIHINIVAKIVLGGGGFSRAPPPLYETLHALAIQAGLLEVIHTIDIVYTTTIVVLQGLNFYC